MRVVVPVETAEEADNSAFCQQESTSVVTGEWKEKDCE